MENLQQKEDFPQAIDAKRPRAYHTTMITGRQIRAARVLIGWSVEELTRQSGVSYATIHRIEHADGAPNVRMTSLVAIQHALEQAGVIFLSPGQHAAGGEGVRMRGGRRRPEE